MLKVFSREQSSGGDAANIAATTKKSAVPNQLFAEMVEQLPINVIVCDKDSFEVIYANSKTIETLKTIEHLLPIKAEELLGTCIDVFHKNPAMQRNMMADPSNLPHEAEIQLGDETLSLKVSALRDKNGNYVAAMVAWSVITGEKLKEAETEKMLQMLDQIPVNVLTCDPDTVVINYANKTSIDTLKEIESLLPCKADDIIGQCIDIFHKNPSTQRNILGDPENLPFETNISLGEETLSLKVSAVHNQDGEYVLALLVWSVITSQVSIASKVDNVASAVAAAATQLKATASSMSGSVDQVKAQAASVASVAEQTSGNVNAVASAAEELAASTDEISRQVMSASEVSSEAMKEAAATGDLIKSLDQAGQKIGDVVSLINEIASQTNLLALNATIEAARAGEAGKGFAVVASEVKALAQQTASATEDITKHIDGMQSATSEVVTAIDGISATIAKVNETSEGISAAVEEQSAATQEIARNTQQAASGTEEVTSAAQTVSAASEEATHGVGEVNVATDELSRQSETLSAEIKEFLAQLGINSD